MKKSRGAGLAQYAIIIALVALVVAPGFYLIGKNLVAYFSKMKEGIDAGIRENQMYSVPDDVIANGMVTAGQLGGSPTDPMRRCAGSNCTIDYGTIVLNNIPENYGEIVETSGSAGSEVVLGLVQSVAGQLENQNSMSPEKLQQIQDLIAHGKDMIEIEKVFEEKYKQNEADILNYVTEKNDVVKLLAGQQITQTQYNEYIKTLQDKYSTMFSNLRAYDPNENITLSSGQTVRTDMTYLLYLLNPNATISYSTANNTVGGAGTSFQDVGFEEFLNSSVTIPDSEEINKMNAANSTASSDYQTLNSPVGSYLQQLKAVLDDEEVDPMLKELTKNLSKEIYEVSQNLSEKSIMLHYIQFDSYYLQSDQARADYEALLNSPPSDTTRLDLSIICNSSMGNYNPDTDTCSGG